MHTLPPSYPCTLHRILLQPHCTLTVHAVQEHHNAVQNRSLNPHQHLCTHVETHTADRRFYGPVRRLPEGSADSFRRWARSPYGP